MRSRTMPANPFKMSPANGSLSRLYLSYSVPVSEGVSLASLRNCPSHHDVCPGSYVRSFANPFSPLFENPSFQVKPTAVIAVFVRNFTNCSGVLMTKNSSPIRLTSTSLIISNDGFSVNQRPNPPIIRAPSMTVDPDGWPKAALLSAGDVLALSDRLWSKNRPAAPG